VSGAPSEPEELAALWDARYGARGRLWSGRVNPVLEAGAAELAPGRALDAGCGEGGDALWLASRGWSVLGHDLSAVAVQRATAEAERLGLQQLAHFAQRDLALEPPETSTFDFVSGQYLHVLPAQRDRLYRGLAAAVRPGGTMLLVLHDRSDLGLGIQRPPAETMPDAESLRAFAVGFRDVVVGRRARTVALPAGGSAVAHDLVLRAVR